MAILIIIIIYILYTDYIRDQKKAAEQARTTDKLVACATTPDQKRLTQVRIFIVSVYVIIFGWLYFAWYRLYPRSNFHWFDDRGEWNQVDKA